MHRPDVIIVNSWGYDDGLPRAARLPADFMAANPWTQTRPRACACHARPSWPRVAPEAKPGATLPPLPSNGGLGAALAAEPAGLTREPLAGKKEKGGGREVVQVLSFCTQGRANERCRTKPCARGQCLARNAAATATRAHCSLLSFARNGNTNSDTRRPRGSNKKQYSKTRPMPPKAPRPMMEGHMQRVSKLRNQREAAKNELQAFRRQLKQERA